ncbi:MAG: sulfotransferase [Thermoguttaceae bacterium]
MSQTALSNHDSSSPEPHPSHSGVRMASWREKFLLRVASGQFAGITTGDWLSLLRDNRYAVDRPYLPRAALVSLISLGNSMLRRCENAVYGASVRKTEVRSPVFILGHWRSGTTHLHNLFAVDHRLAYPNFYQVVFPHTFLCTEPIGTRLLALLVPKRRLGDNVAQHVGMPAEDEHALCVATLLSPYLGWSFPRRKEHYDRYLTMSSVPDREIVHWKQGLKLFLQKLTWKHRRPLVLKSPAHTCRIRLLLELFPDARFVHVHRNPYAVFMSIRRRHDVAVEYFRLQRSVAAKDEMLIRRYSEMYDHFFAERPLIPACRYHEVAFEDLEQDPIGQLREIYAKLDLPDFGAVETPVREYVASLSGYRKNEYPELSATLRSQIGSAWRRSFEEWGYSL